MEDRPYSYSSILTSKTRKARLILGLGCAAISDRVGVETGEVVSQGSDLLDKHGHKRDGIM